MKKYEDDKREYFMELQFHLCSLMMAKQGEVKTINEMVQPLKVEHNGHLFYEQARVLKDAAASKVLDAKASELYKRALDVYSKCNLDAAPEWQWVDMDDVHGALNGDEFTTNTINVNTWYNSKDAHTCGLVGCPTAWEDWRDADDKQIKEDNKKYEEKQKTN